MFKKTITQLFILTIVLSSIFIANGLILAWTSPGSTPPSSNVSPPINTSATAQTKSGSLRSSADMRAPIFYDQNNTGYYVDPASTSRLNYGVYDNLYSYGWMQSPIFYDANNTGYYVDPASTSKFNTINLGGVSKSSWPSGGLSGYEIKTASKRSAYHFTVDIYCSPGKKILGGGCNQEAGGNRAIVDNNPIGTTGWHCRGRDINTAQTVTMTAYAICAILD